MKSFLSSVAEFLLQQDHPLHEQTVVLPSRRAAIFLQRELIKQCDRPLLAPRMMSIEDLIFESTGLQRISRPELYFQVFECLKKNGRADLQFEEFNRWGKALIQDFNEVDRYLVDPQEIFSYLGDLKRIESWNLEAGEHTRMLDDYLKFWPSLAKVHTALQANLKANGKAYQGMAYRAFADASSREVDRLKEAYGHFYFIGFNALNAAEEKGLLNLYEVGIASFYWDVDPYYFKDPKQEAGLFLRQSNLLRQLQKNGAYYGLEDSLSKDPRSLETYAIAGHNLQAVVSAQILSELDADALESTAVILSNEGLLPAFLNNFHPKFPKLNLSMGLSLQNSPMAGFFEILLDFPLDAERHARKDKANWSRYHYKRWEALLRHPLSVKLTADQPQALRDSLAEIKRRNLLYPSWKDLGLSRLGALSLDYFKVEQPPVEQYRRLVDFCEQSLAILANQSSLQEALFGFHQLFKQTAELLEQYPYVEKFETSLQFYREMLPELSIDLRGEPLQGMQLMGWLETRCLDFENLVVLSLNEGILPKGRSESSLIPFDVKRKFKLPTYLEKDAVFAYHFYRLMQRAKNIHLLYSTAEAALGVVEPSRFLRQLSSEWPEKNRRLEIKNHNVTGYSDTNRRPEKVSKSPAVLERLAEMAERGFSPSSLIKYLRDPLEFYYEKVLGLKPEEDLQEELDLPTQGSAVHRYLELLFSTEHPENPEDRLARTPNPEDPIFSQSREAIKHSLKELMQQESPGLILDQGPNLLHLESMSSMLQNFLNEEQKRIRKIAADWKVLATEKDLEGKITLDDGREIKLLGNADRIDSEAGVIHIIDYKTGGAAANKYNVSNCDLESYIKKPEALQLPVYALMYAQAQAELDIRASIFSLRKVKQNPIAMKFGKERVLSIEKKEEITTVLKELITELMDPEIPFQSRE